MDPPSLEAFLVFLNKQKGLSAPGPSKFRYCLLLRAPLEVKKILHLVVCLCLRLEGLPASLKAAYLYPIPKQSQSRLLSQMRPISLLEIGYKLTTGWLAYNIRNKVASSPEPLWHNTQ